MLAFFLAEIESISSLEACRQRLDVLFAPLVIRRTLWGKKSDFKFN